MKKICQKVQKISVATEAMRKYFKKLLPKKEILKIPCGVDFELFYKKRHPTLSINEDGAKIILYQGQINEFTGCHYIPNIAFDLIFKLKQEDIKFLIVGGGPYLKTLKKEIDRKKMSNYFIFTGSVPHSTIPNYIAEASICLALSPSRFNVNMGVFPIKIVEYMAMNKLVVSTNIAEVYHIISDWQTGVISTPSNIAQNISKLLDDVKLIELIGKNAGKTAKLKYDWKVIIKELLNFWEIS